MKTNKLQKFISIVTAFAVVIAMAPGITFKAEAASGSTFNYVAIGDSTTNGFGMEGYTDEVRGFLQIVKTAYPYLIKSKLEDTYGEGNVNLSQLASSAMRPEELDAILDVNHVNDDYTNRVCYDSDGEEWFKDWANQIPGVSIQDGENSGEQGEQALRQYYTSEIEDADLITYYLGQNSFGTFITGFLIDQRYGDDDTLQDLLGYLELEGIDADEITSMIKQVISSEVSEEYTTALGTTYDGLVDIFTQALVGYMVYFDKNIKKIREINPDCDIVVVGLKNYIGTLNIEVGGQVADLGAIYNKVIDFANKYASTLSAEKGEYSYADLQSSNLQTFYKEFDEKNLCDIAQEKLDGFIGDIVKGMLPSELQDYSTQFVAAAREWKEDGDYEAIGTMLSGYLSANETANQILGMGFTAAEILEAGYLYKTRDDSFPAKLAALIEAHEAAVKEALGENSSYYSTILTLIKACKDVDAFDSALSIVSGLSTSIDEDEIKNGLNTIGSIFSDYKIDVVGSINDMLLDCVDKDSVIKDALDIFANGLDFDTEEIGQQILAGSISDKNKSLINLYFMASFYQGIGAHPDEVGHATMANIIWKAYQNKTTVSNDVKTSCEFEYKASSDSFYTSIGDSVAEIYSDKLAYELNLDSEDTYAKPAQVALRASDVLYLLGDTSKKDAYTEEILKDVDKDEFIDDIEKSDVITIGLGLDSMTKYIQWAISEESYDPDLSRFEDGESAEALVENLLPFVEEYLNDLKITKAQAQRAAKAFVYARLSLEEDYTEVLNKIHSKNSNAKVAVLGLYNILEGATYTDGDKLNISIGNITDTFLSEYNAVLKEYAEDNSSWCGYISIYEVKSRMNITGSKTDFNVKNGTYFNVITENDFNAVYPSEKGKEYIVNQVLYAFGLDGICDHKDNLKHVAAKDATCIIDGNIEYYYCEDCGRYFSDKNCTQVIKDTSTLVIEAKHNIGHVDAKEKTCTTDGYKEYYECEDCHTKFKDSEGLTEISDEEFETDYVISKSHNPEFVKAKEKTCEEDGNIAYYYCKDCDKCFSDSECKTEITKASTVTEKSHGTISRIPATTKTCTADGHKEYYECEDCHAKFKDSEGKTEISDEEFEKDYVIKKSHNLEKIEKKDATCEETGIKLTCYYCKDCKKYFEDEECTKELTEDEVIAPKSHNLIEHKEDPATCENEGCKAYWECETCGSIFLDQNGISETTKDKLVTKPHSKTLRCYLAENATYTSKGHIKYWYCKECGKFFTDAGITEVEKDEVYIDKLTLNKPVSKSAVLKTYRKVTFTWNKVADATGYKVYYKKNSSNSWKSVTVKGKTSYTTPELYVGSKYEFKVKAYYKDDDGTAYSAYSKTKTVNTLKKITGVKATKSALKAKVKWNKVTGATGYQISKTTKKNKTDVVATVKNLSSKRISAAKGKTYYYKVRAYKTVNGKKVYGPWSAAVKYKRK